MKNPVALFLSFQEKTTIVSEAKTKKNSQMAIEEKCSKNKKQHRTNHFLNLMIRRFNLHV